MQKGDPQAPARPCPPAHAGTPEHDPGSGRNLRISGFSLLELLIATAILAVVISLTFVRLDRYLTKIRLDRAQQVLVQALDEARSEARRRSLDQVVSWSLQNNRIVVSGSTVTLPKKIELVDVKGSSGSTVTYTAPYGRLAGPDLEFVLGDSLGHTAAVRLVGVMGKVIRVEP